MLGVGAQRVGADRDVARLRDRRRDLGAGETAALAGLGALVDLDLDVAHLAQVGAGDAEVTGGGLQALPLHVLVGGEPQRAALARRRHAQAGAALDAGHEELLAGRAQRGRRVRDRAVPDRLADAEAGEHEAAARLALEDDGAVGGGAQHGGAVRAVADGAQLGVADRAVGGDGAQQQAASSGMPRPVRRSGRRVVAGSRHARARLAHGVAVAEAHLEPAALVGLEARPGPGGPAPRAATRWRAAPRRPAAGSRAARPARCSRAGPGSRRSRSSAQATLSRESFSLTRSSEYGALVARRRRSRRAPAPGPPPSGR